MTAAHSPSFDEPAESTGSPSGPKLRDPGEPLFIRKTLIVASIVSAFVVAFLLLAYAPDALILTFAAVWFGCVLHFAAKTLSRWTRLPERWSLTVVVSILILLTVGFFALLGWQLAGRIDELATNLQESVQSLLKNVEKQFPQVKGLIRRTPPEKAAQVVLGGQTGSTVSGLLATPVGFAINVLYIFFTGLYLAASHRMYLNGLVALVPVHRRAKVRHVCDEAGEALWGWTLARIASMVLVGVLSWIGLALLGIPMAAVLAVLTALLVFIPNIGPVLSLLPPMLLAMSQGAYAPLYVVALYTGIQLVESYLITPIIHQHEDNLAAALVIAVQLLFGILFGLLGVAFAMPIALVAMLFVQRFYVERGLEGTNVERELGKHSEG
ncbi:MAG: AI-2E family transporter [Planctomycetota bacterium]|nr:AI-2E family transporter [Planctomycetaceae bacterium]MDQ3331517.1 AI-2E family transporter [Planctomycetota bacterium]